MGSHHDALTWNDLVQKLTHWLQDIQNAVLFENEKLSLTFDFDEGADKLGENSAPYLRNFIITYERTRWNVIATMRHPGRDWGKAAKRALTLTPEWVWKNFGTAYFRDLIFEEFISAAREQWTDRYFNNE